jgi:hypothetical protein
MNDSTTSATTKSFQVVMAIAVMLVCGVAVLSLFSHHQATPNDSIGRYQMHVTETGTIVVMDTVGGAITNVSRIDDYHTGGEATGDSPGDKTR